MTATLRLALTVFSVGFLVEGLGDLYTFVTRAAVLPGGGLLVYFAPAFTVVGLVSLWLGRHEWNELHKGRVRHAHLSFGVTVVLSVVAAISVGLAYLLPASVPEPTAGWVFGAAVAGLLWFLYLTYGLAAGHLTGTVGKLLVVLALVWAAVAALLLGDTARSFLPSLLSSLSHRALTEHAVLDPFVGQLSLLFVTYLLLFVAFLDAHRRVVRGDAAGGRGPVGGAATAAPPVSPTPPR